MRLERLDRLVKASPPVRRERAGFFDVLAKMVEEEGRALRGQIRAIGEEEYRERTKGACLLCRDDEPSGTYRGRPWCRACRRIW